MHETEASRAGQMSKQSYAAVLMSTPASEHEMPDPPADPSDDDDDWTYFKKKQALYDLMDEQQQHKLDNEAINHMRQEMHRQQKGWPSGALEDESDRCDILRYYLAGRTYHFETVKCHLWRLQEHRWTTNPEWLRLDPLE